MGGPRAGSKNGLTALNEVSGGLLSRPACLENWERVSSEWSLSKKCAGRVGLFLTARIAEQAVAAAQARYNTLSVRLLARQPARLPRHVRLGPPPSLN